VVKPELFDKVLPRLDEFMVPFVESISRTELVGHAETIVSGLLPDLEAITGAWHLSLHLSFAGKQVKEEDRKTGVISDQIVKFGGSKTDASQDHTVRLVIVSASEHTSRGSAATGSSTGPSCDGKLRLATDLLDIPAELIAEANRLKVADRIVLQNVQATAALPPSAEHKTGRC
jgi:hypothetical protein